MIRNARIRSTISLQLLVLLSKNILDSVVQSHIINNFMNADPVHDIHILGIVNNIHNGITYLYSKVRKE